ncbi:putative GPI anchored glycoprotein [Aspergillus lucknowensis]|uniref:GPI anchored glycoprotein n=1 Tax=Aspergillus lucknowensis TaxID=176173 RepID=A0ABR4M057_9EURO
MRPQIIRSVTLLGCSSFAVANDIVSLILPNVDQQDLVGEVVGSDGPTTTYVIQCPRGADSVDCGVPSNGFTVTAGPSTFVFDYTFEDYSLRESCSHRDTTWFSCVVTNTQSGFSSVMTSAESLEIPYQAVTITATEIGARPGSSATTTATSATTTSSETESSDSNSDPDSPTTNSAQPSDSATPTDSEAEAETTSSDNAAIAQVTGSAAQWLLSGAGMALALAIA